MKKILLLFLLFASTLLTVRTYGQATCTGGTASCNLIPQDVRIEVVSKDCLTIPGKAIVTFNINFKLEANDGNKQIYFHSWLLSDYPAGIGSSIFPCAGGTENNPFLANILGGVGDNGELGFSILDIGLLNTASGDFDVPQAMGIRASNGTGGYTPDNTVLLVSPNGPNPTAPDMEVWKTLLDGGAGPDLDSISMINVVVTVPVADCVTPIAVKSLIWAAQSPSGDNAQCWAAHIGQSVDDPSIALVPLCGNPRQYSYSLQTGNTSPTQFDYTITLIDPLGVASPIVIFDSTITKSAADGLVSIGPVTVPFPYGNMGPWASWDIQLDVTSPSFSNTITTGLIGQDACATLPIKLRSFDATRNRSNVDLKWVTEVETNNKGFFVERKLSNGEWQQISFVASKAPDGNSNSPLTYVLTDFNNTKGISQYRLRQMDFDGKQSFSQIRSVRGEGQKSNTIIYPNPSGDGKVSVVFEGSNSMRDVSLIDVSGKTLRQWKGVTNNNIQIDNLNSGFYTVRIVNVETGEQVVEKFIVNKR